MALDEMPTLYCFIKIILEDKQQARLNSVDNSFAEPRHKSTLPRVYDSPYTPRSHALTRWATQGPPLPYLGKSLNSFKYIFGVMPPDDLFQMTFKLPIQMSLRYNFPELSFLWELWEKELRTRSFQFDRLVLIVLDFTKSRTYWKKTDTVPFPAN